MKKRATAKNIWQQSKWNIIYAIVAWTSWQVLYYLFSAFVLYKSRQQMDM